MKITKSQLRELIKEELEQVLEEEELDEGFLDRLLGRGGKMKKGGDMVKTKVYAPNNRERIRNLQMDKDEMGDDIEEFKFSLKDLETKMKSELSKVRDLVLDLQDNVPSGEAFNKIIVNLDNRIKALEGGR